MKANKLLTLAIILLSNYLSGLTQSGKNLFDESYIHEIRLYSSDTNIWDSLEADFYDVNLGLPEFKIYRPVSILIDSNKIDSVGLRIKGFYSALGAGSRKKKPLKVDINFYNSEQEYDGLKKFNLQNAYEDPTFMRDILAYNIFREEGLVVSRTSYARVYINDIYWGLYILIEQVDKTFLDEHFLSNEGNLYKSMDATDLRIDEQYKDLIELKTNEEENDWTRFERFIEIINKTGLSNKDYEYQVQYIFNIEDYLKILAIDLILANWDSYYEHGRNFYIYDEPVTNKFNWIPWDYNLSFSQNYPFQLVITKEIRDKPLINNLLDRPIFLKLYVEAYMNILNDNFTTERLYPIIDSTQLFINEAVLEDTNKFYSDESFIKSLNEGGIDTIYHINSYSCYLDSTFFWPLDGTIVHDSVWNYFSCFIDTTWQDVEFDTLINNNDTTIMLNIVESWKEEYYYVGLKPYIKDRISMVSGQVEDIRIPVEPNAITTIGDNRNFFVYPNPVNEFLIIYRAFPESEFKVTVLNMAGQIVLEEYNQEIICLSGVNSGIYLLVYEGTDNKYVLQFVKQ